MTPPPRPPTLSRRLVLCGTSLSAATALASCRATPRSRPSEGDAAAAAVDEHRRGRLVFRPTKPRSKTGRTGRFDVDSGGAAAPVAVYVPPDASNDGLRVVVMLHGAGGKARSALDILLDEADAHRLLLVAPQSAGRTWDVLVGGYGPDVRTIDRLLRRISAAYRIRGYAIGGFSDGASYALSLGIANGDVFDSVVAFSPGFAAARTEHGSPRFFVSHGTEDRVLPIERCSRRIVPALRRSGYAVTYREFAGGHAIPGRIQQDAVAWLSE